MKKLSFLFIILSFIFVSCGNDNEPPAIVDQHNKTFNTFMAEQNVVNQIPATLTTGTDAPFYLIDPQRLIYMKVISDNGVKLTEGQECYFRHTTYILQDTDNGVKPVKSSSTEDVLGEPALDIRYFSDSNVPTIIPLRHIGNWSEVYLVIREISDKSDAPLLMHIRYFPKGL